VAPVDDMLAAGYRKPETGPDAAPHRATDKDSVPRHEPFQHINELVLLPRLPRAVVDRVLPYLTVYGGGELAGSNSEAARP
jgi:type II secretory pathway component PulK